MKLVLVAMLVGGAAGLVLGRRDVPPIPREQWLKEAEAALTGDAQSSDLERALHTVDRVLERGDDPEARALKAQLERQRACRKLFDEAEHFVAIGDRTWAAHLFGLVGPECRLYELAQVEAVMKRPLLQVDPP